ncbi:unnamed protein product [Oppiella nova]|uniref:Alpha-soluble NSF attachment protein n=1 Tax=Oppiella nova TaxID=334625 RepID=A0A7R9M2E3_9ACAR|nr:unnamed protein product [Oppiella nova]CAG2168994.1 unnamed protein product [Oppiella nova]
MADSEAKGNQYLAEAQKKLKSSQGFFGGLLGGGSRQDEALELYVRAANSFKMAKKWNAAGNAFCEAALLHLKNGNKHDSGTHYVDAANCYKKADPQEAINCLMKSIEIYTDMGRFTTAAKHHMTVAEIYETDLPSPAVDIYESVANQSIESPLLKYAAKEHYFRAALCHLCIDQLNAQLAVKKYEEMYPQFSDSRECKLLKQLLERLEENDVDGYTAAIQEYDSISRLDQWYTNILLQIKKQIESDSDMK